MTLELVGGAAGGLAVVGAVLLGRCTVKVWRLVRAHREAQEKLAEARTVRRLRDWQRAA